ncbi:MAG TPA: permease prefix domain 1-containing protein [Thermomicrobiales bacterium]|nr:permease prefix domain 1-containing protein [Thermomicrobiales bacterium]
MNVLIERYVAAALDKTPDRQRAEVNGEIRAAIDEMVEQRTDAGEPEDRAVRAALTELGDPGSLAASYDERPRHLIGPGWYPAYIKVLKRVLAIALPIIAVFAMVEALAVDNGDLVDALQSGLVGVFSIGLQVLFWVTVGFVIAERTMEPDWLAQRGRAWSVDDLPEAPRARQITLSDTLFSVGSLVIFGGLALIQHAGGVGAFVRNGAEGYEHLMVINPDLGAGWQVGFFALILLSIGVEIAKYLRGVWTRPLFMITIVESVLWIGYIVALAASEPIFNPELAERLDEGATWWETGGQANMIIAIVIIAITLWESWEAWQGHREYRSRRAGSAIANAANAN